MSVPTQEIAAGHLQEACDGERSRLKVADAVSKIWSKETALWKDDAQHARIIANRLGWITVLDSMREEVTVLTDLARELVESGTRDIVLLGMGGSSLASEVFARTFPTPSGRRFFVLDTTDPESILQVERSIDLQNALFVASSKSGNTIETLSLMFYFQDRLRNAGNRLPGRNFIAITDRGSYLERIGEGYGFRVTFRNPPDIGGRYSALSYFGLVPAALWGVNIADVLDCAIEMRAACGPEANPDSNPALALGSLLGVAAREGHDKLVLLSGAKLAPLANWIEQLIAESTGKDQGGILPITGDAPPMPVLLNGCVTVALQFEGEQDAAITATINALEQEGEPVIRIRISDPAQIGAEFFKWELATALTGAALSIDPFDEPNVQESKENTVRILDLHQSTGILPTGSRRTEDAGIQLYAESMVGADVSRLLLSDALRTFVGQRRVDDYLAILAYVARDDAYGGELNALRALLTARLEMPVLLGYGPRYLHSIGQLFKGGPASGMFLMITAEKSEDVPVPGAKYGFTRLQMAQALGDQLSLAQLGKPVIRLHLTQGAAAGLPELRRKAEQAFAASRPATP